METVDKLEERNTLMLRARKRTRIPRPHRTYISLSADYHELLQTWATLCGCCRGVAAAALLEQALTEGLKTNRPLLAMWRQRALDKGKRGDLWPE